MLPLSHKDSPQSAPTKIHQKLKGWFRLIFADKNSRNLFLFLILNLSFAFVELSYGIWTNSLGLISDSFHMFFDCTGLLAGLVATVITRWRANEKYSFGYVRAEVLNCSQSTFKAKGFILHQEAQYISYLQINCFKYLSKGTGFNNGDLLFNQINMNILLLTCQVF
jgi:Cation efflux family